MADNIYRVTISKDGRTETKDFSADDYNNKVQGFLSQNYKPEEYSITNLETTTPDSVTKGEQYLVTATKDGQSESKQFDGDFLVGGGIAQLNERFGGDYSIQRINPTVKTQPAEDRQLDWRDAMRMKNSKNLAQIQGAGESFNQTAEKDMGQMLKDRQFVDRGKGTSYLPDYNMYGGVTATEDERKRFNELSSEIATAEQDLSAAEQEMQNASRAMLPADDMGMSLKVDAAGQQAAQAKYFAAKSKVAALREEQRKNPAFAERMQSAIKTGENIINAARGNVEGLSYIASRDYEKPEEGGISSLAGIRGTGGQPVNFDTPELEAIKASGKYNDYLNYQAMEQLASEAVKSLNATTSGDFEDKGFWGKIWQGTKGIGQGVIDRTTNAEFWSSVKKMQDNTALYDLHKKIESLMGEGNIELSSEKAALRLEDGLSESEKKLLAAYIYSAQSANLAGDPHWTYNAGGSIADSAKMAAMMMAFNGVTGAASEGVSNAIVNQTAKWMRALGEKGASDLAIKSVKAAGKFVASDLGAITGGAVQTLLNPTTVGNIFEAVSQVDPETGRLSKIGVAIGSSLVNDLVENATEFGFGVANKGLGVLNKALAKTEFGKMFKYSDGVRDALERMGLASGLEEWGEEVNNAYINQILSVIPGYGDKNSWKQFWTAENQLTLLFSFGPTIGGGAAISAGQRAYINSKERSLADQLTAALTRNGRYTQDKVNSIMESFKGVTPEEVANNASPFLSQLLYDVREDRELSKLVCDYAVAKTNSLAVNGAEKAENDSRMKQAYDTFLNNTGHDFTVTEQKGGISYRNVETLEYPNGVRFFIVGEKTQKNGRTQLMLMDEAGKSSYIYTDQLEGVQYQRNKQSVDDFLKQEIVRADAQVERQRMDSEYAQQIQNMMANTPVGSSFEYGPEGQKVTATVAAVDNNGAQLSFSAPVMIDGQQVTTAVLDWGKVADAKGQSIHVYTDAQLASREAQNYRDHELARKAVNDALAGGKISVEGKTYTILKAVANRAVDKTDGKMMTILAKDQFSNQTVLYIPFEELSRNYPSISVPQFAVTKAEASAQTNGNTAQENASQGVVDDGMPRDFRGNPIPTNSDGSINGEQFFANDPEAWCRWNDEEKQDNGADSRGYLDVAIATNQKAIAEAKQASITMDQKARTAALQQVDALMQKDATYRGILAQYEQRDIDAQAQASANLADEEKAMIEGLSAEEKVAYYESKAKDAEKRLGELKAPEMGTDIRQYLTDKKAYSEQKSSVENELAGYKEAAKIQKAAIAKFDKDLVAALNGKATEDQYDNVIKTLALASLSNSVAPDAKDDILTSLNKVVRNYADSIGADGNLVVTDNDGIMAEFSKVANQESIRNLVRSAGTNGVYLGGRVYLTADAFFEGVESVRNTFVHERTHGFAKNTARGKKAIKDLLATGISQSELESIVAKLSGNEFYKGMKAETLADEAIAHAMELAYSVNAGELADKLKEALGEVSNDKFINIITEYDNEQRKDESLSKARRGGTAGLPSSNVNAAGVRADESVSSAESGAVAEQGSGAAAGGKETAGFKVTPAQDIAEANGISEQTAQMLTDRGLTMAAGLVMDHPHYALMNATGYLTPNERNTDLDHAMFSKTTLKPWAEHYRTMPDSEERVVRAVQSWGERAAASELVNSVISQGEYEYRKPGGEYRAKGKDAGPLRTNVEYIVTFDMDTTCPRTFEYLNYSKVIEKRIGRPLTQIECVQLIEYMRAFGQQIPCVYCYAENKRQALKQYYTDFMESRHAVLSAKTEKEALAAMYGHKTDKTAATSTDPKVVLTDAAYTVFKQWRELSKQSNLYNPTIKVLWHQYNNTRNAVLTQLDMMLEDKSINAKMTDEAITKAVCDVLGITNVEASKVVADIVNEWKWDATESVAHNEFTPMDEDDIYADQNALALWREMTAYAKSASSAKSVLRYTPYTDELRYISPEDKAFINGMGGVRMHSSNDFRIDYVLDYFQFMADMAAEKMFGHTYTKSPEFVKIFGNSGYRINMSIAAYQDENGNITQNEDEGFNWEEAKKLRSLFPNAGIMLMATSDEQIQMALDSDWIDMFIPFHNSGLPNYLWQDMRAWTNYQSVQNESFYSTEDMRLLLAEKGYKFKKSGEAAAIKTKFREVFGEPEAILYKSGKNKGKRVRPHFLPGATMVEGEVLPGWHRDEDPENDTKRYFELCRRYQVKPRFYGTKVKDANGNEIDITEHPNYIKCIKETARMDSTQGPVQFNFDQPSEALREALGRDGDITPMDYAFEELEARAMAENEAAGKPVRDIYESTKKDSFGIVPMFINTVIKHKKETGEDYPADYLAPEVRQAQEEIFGAEKEVPYHKNDYDTNGKFIAKRPSMRTTEDWMKNNGQAMFKVTPEIRQEMDNIVAVAKKNGTYLKANNGADTKLNPEQWAMVRTKGFKNWFGLWEEAYLFNNLFSRSFGVVGDAVVDTISDSKILDSIIASIPIDVMNNFGGEKGAAKMLLHNPSMFIDIMSLASTDSFVPAFAMSSMKVIAFSRAKLAFTEPTSSNRELLAAISTLQDNLIFVTARLSGCSQLLGFNEVIPFASITAKDFVVGESAAVGTGVKDLHKNSIFIKDIENYDKYQTNLLKIVDTIETNASKVVDENGEPMVVYHSTDNVFNTFDKKRQGENTDYNASSVSISATAHLGFWMANNPENWTSQHMQLFLNAKNPLRFENLAELFDSIEIIVSENNMIDASASEIAGVFIKNYITEYDYDGIIVAYDFEHGNDKSYVVFSSNQIKSATVNNGEFSKENDDIRFSFGLAYDYNKYPLGKAEANLSEKQFTIAGIEHKHNFNLNQKTVDLRKEVYAYIDDPNNKADVYGIVNMEDGTPVNVSKSGISKMIDDAVKAGEDESKYLDLILSVKDAIKVSVDGETHPDFKKGADDRRSPENGYNKDVIVHRAYAAVKMDDKIYRAKATIYEDIRRGVGSAHTFELTKIELIDGKRDGANAESPTSINSISGANLLKNCKKSYEDKDILQASIDDNINFSVTPQQDVDYSININNDSGLLDKIMSGEKTIETRKAVKGTDRSPLSAENYKVGDRVALIATGKEQAVKGYATISEIKEYNTEEEWLADADKHLVANDPDYKWDGTKRFGYVLTDVEEEPNPYKPTTFGISGRKSKDGLFKVTDNPIQEFKDMDDLRKFVKEVNRYLDSLEYDEVDPEDAEELIKERFPNLDNLMRYNIVELSDANTNGEERFIVMGYEGVDSLNERTDQQEVDEAINFVTGKDDVRFRFVGLSALLKKAETPEEKQAIKNNFNAAKIALNNPDLTEDDFRKIKIATGWEKGADNKMRYEEDDFYMNENAITYQSEEGGMYWPAKKLGELLNPADEFLKEYPQIAEIDVQPQMFIDGTHGGYSSKNNLIEINYKDMDFNKDTMEVTFNEDSYLILLHEVQHAIQGIENWAVGGNLSTQGGFDAYNRLAGEVEARNVADRATMTDGERRRTLASKTEDVARGNQIVKMAYRDAMQMNIEAARERKATLEKKDLITDDYVRFSISRNTKDTIRSWYRKANDGKDTDQMADVLINYLEETFDDTTSQLAAAKWYLNGTIVLPDEDVYKVEQAVATAKIHKVDPLSYDSPMSIIDQFGEFKPKEKPIDPDTISTLHLVNKFDSGISIYNVDESQESRENMRKIINTHFGKDSSPWCLLQGYEDGVLTLQSARYWRHYSAYPKQVAFKDGKLTAFSANSANEKLWWDRTDEPHNDIPVVGKIKGDELGRSGTVLYDSESGKYVKTIRLHKESNGRRTEWYDGEIRLDRYSAPGVYVRYGFDFSGGGGEDIIINSRDGVHTLYHLSNGEAYAKEVYRTDILGRTRLSAEIVKPYSELFNELTSRGNWHGRRVLDTLFGEYEPVVNTDLRTPTMEDAISFAENAKVYGTLIDGNNIPSNVMDICRDAYLSINYVFDGTDEENKRNIRYAKNRFRKLTKDKDFADVLRTTLNGPFLKPFEKHTKLIEDLQNLGYSGYTAENAVRYFSAPESDDYVRFSVVKDKDTLDRLNSEPTRKMYCSMTLLNPEETNPSKWQLVPVKSAKVNGMMRPVSMIGQWEQADEDPAMRKKNGKFDLKDFEGTSVNGVNYNPYFHLSDSMMNDQFTGAYNKPNTVVVEVEVPESEVTSGYHAEGAANSVGILPWHSGTVNAQLPKDKQRNVMLSRWRKPVRVVPNSEVAQFIADKLAGTDIAMPWNLVTPDVLNELDKLGVKIGNESAGLSKKISRPDAETRFKVNSNGEQLSAGQQEYFKNSEAVDVNGNLLVLYHGTDRAGFNEFKSGWFTTSKRDADSYGGNDEQGTLYDPNEKPSSETYTAGDYRLSYMTFDSEEDRAKFLSSHPLAEEALAMDQYDAELDNADYEGDEDRVNELESKKNDYKKIQDDYRAYENSRLVATGIGDLLNNPDAFSIRDYERAIYSMDRNAVLDSIDEIDDEAERKEAIVDALQYFVDDAVDNGADRQDVLDSKVNTRVPRNGSGIHNKDLKHRTYKCYANIEKPFVIDANGKHSEFESGNIYSAIEEARKDDKYDGVIVRNWRVGRYQDMGDVVIPKKSSQIKLTTNLNPTESDDIRFKVTPEQDAAFREAYEKGDNETAQKMLDEVARKAGYRYKAFHGTPDGGFTVFDNSHRFGEMYFTDNDYISKSYMNDYNGSNPMVYSAYLRISNPLRYDAREKSYSEMMEDNKIEKLVRKAKENGNGGVIIKNIYDALNGWSKDPANLGTDYLVLNPSNIKSADPFTFDDNGDLISLSERFNVEDDDIRFKVTPKQDAEYLNAVEAGDMEKAQEMVDKAAKAAGYKTGLVYHGSPAKFNEFDVSKAGYNGAAIGYGIYFATDENVSKGYATSNGQLLRGYLNMSGKILSNRKVTLTMDEIESMIRKFDPTGDELLVNTAKETRDYPSKTWYERSLREAVKYFANQSESDESIISEISLISGSKSAIASMLHDMGYAGYKKKNAMTLADGTKVDYYVALSSSQFKMADPVTYDNDGKVIPLSERFNNRDTDIRFKVAQQSKLGDILKNGLSDTLSEEEVENLAFSIYNNLTDEQRGAILSASPFTIDTKEAIVRYFSGLAQVNELDDEQTAMVMSAANSVSGYLNEQVYPNDVLWMMYDESQPAGQHIIERKANEQVKRRLEQSAGIAPTKTLDEFLAEADAAKNDIIKQYRALRAVADNLDSIGAAMGRRANYDRNTVGKLVNLCRSLLSSRLMDNVTKSDVIGMMSVIRKATGMRNIQSRIDSLYRKVLKNQLSNLDDMFDKIMKLKGVKVNQNGVQVQSRLDLEGQKIMDIFKTNIENQIGDESNPDEGTVNALIEKAKEKLADPATMDDAVLELTGLRLAKDYINNVKQSKQEEYVLTNDLKELEKKHEEGKISDKDFRKARKEAQRLLNENRAERVEQYTNLVQDLTDIVNASKSMAREFAEREKQRIQDIYHDSNRDLEGTPARAQREAPTAWQKTLNSGLMRFFLAPLATFDQMLRMFGSKNVKGEGYLYNRFMRSWIDKSGEEFNAIQEAYGILDAKVSEVFGEKMRWSDLYHMESKMPKMELRYLDQDGIETRKLSQGNMLYILLADAQTEGRMKLRAMAIDDMDIDAIEQNIDPRFLQLARWIVDDFFPSRRGKYNEVYERMFGSSMPKVRNYFPIRTLADDRVQKVDIATGLQQASTPSSITGSIIKRVRNTTAIDLATDAFSEVIANVNQMEHWAAFAEWNRDLSTLLSYKRFRNQVKNMNSIYGSGEELWKSFNDVCMVAAGSYRPDVKQFEKGLLKAAKGVTAAKISLRMFTAFKQLGSYPAYFGEANPVKLITNLVTMPVSAPKAWSWAMENLPLFKKRWMSRKSGDHILDIAPDWNSKITEEAAKFGMSPNAFVDAVTVALGAYSIYQAKVKTYGQMGYTNDDAEEKAKQDAVILYNETQQSSEKAFLSPMQSAGTWLSTTLTIFRNSSMGYQRQEVDAIRNIARRLDPDHRRTSVEFMAGQMIEDGIEPSKAYASASRLYNRQFWKDAFRAVNFGFMMQFSWYLMSKLPYLLFGDDDDKKEEMIEDVATHAMFGSIEGLSAGNGISDFGYNLAMGNKISDSVFPAMPLVSDIKSAIDKIGTDNVGLIADFVNLVGQATVGINPQTLSDMFVATMDACEGNPKIAREALIFAMRVLQVPQSQINELYLDEIDLSVKEAQSMTISELAERYARYKRRRRAGMMNWMYSDEQAGKDEAKYTKQFGTMAKERLKENELDGKFEQYKQEATDLSDRIKDLRLRFKDGDAEADKELRDIFLSPDYGRLQRFLDAESAMDSEINAAVKAKDIDAMIGHLDKVDELKADLVEDFSGDDGSTSFIKDQYTQYTKGLLAHMDALNDQYEDRYFKESEEYKSWEESRQEELDNIASGIHDNRARINEIEEEKRKYRKPGKKTYYLANKAQVDALNAEKKELEEKNRSLQARKAEMKKEKVLVPAEYMPEDIFNSPEYQAYLQVKDLITVNGNTAKFKAIEKLDKAIKDAKDDETRMKLEKIRDRDIEKVAQQITRYLNGLQDEIKIEF